ncbi:MAG: DUF2141 domain-containing protein [Colwellia sp.]|nr:DUF2141 domain-containing protein [Colwellia sp.]
MTFQKLLSYSASSLFMAAIGSLSMITLLSQHAVAADLTVNISDIEQGKGYVLVALYADQESYTSGKASFSSRVKAEHDQETLVFENLPDGEYAIKLYQDENDNNKLDFNILGIPKEGYGFSNNVGMFGAPDYVDAKFTIKENTAIKIELF